jgi:hypothetical protein
MVQKLLLAIAVASLTPSMGLGGECSDTSSQCRADARQEETACKSACSDGDSSCRRQCSETREAARQECERDFNACLAAKNQDHPGPSPSIDRPVSQPYVTGYTPEGMPILSNGKIAPPGVPVRTGNNVCTTYGYQYQSVRPGVPPRRILAPVRVGPCG